MSFYVTDKDGKLVKVAGNYLRSPDKELSTTSTNVVQNDVITKALNNKLSLTGGTLTGELINNSSVRYNMSFIDQYTNPSSTKYKVSEWFYDKNNKPVGVRHLAQFNNGKIEQQIDVRRDINNDGTTSYASLVIGMQSNGTAYAKAPNPASNSNTNDIATTSWVRTFILNTLYPVGTIYISKNKSCAPASLGGTWNLVEEGYALWTTTTNDQGGQTISAGLPNIKGNVEIRTCANGSLFGNNSGALDGVTHGGDQTWANGLEIKSTSGKVDRLYFNANSYNSIYSDSITTVQPPAYKIYAYRRDA